MEQAEEPRYMRDFHRGRCSYFCVNGDYYHSGKKVLFNPKHFRDFPHYLDHLTDQLKPPFGAVRRICTPNYGHAVRSLEDLQPDGVYVAAGPGRFKPYG
ncbi:hypothetical protein BaRGS_00019576 [Batillaria attramentaria]|uniref:Doublecortin domain-containing protein n=1 Tax=Batillaria attramentaria TaxID=370345 RepID=A0ABD0KQP2_9CAEN